MIDDIKDRIKLFKTTDTRNPLEIHLFIKKCLNASTRIIIGDYFDKNWRWNWKVNHLLILIFLTGFFYAFYGYQNRNDLTEVLISFCLGLFVLVGLQRLLNFILGRDEYIVVLTKIETFIEVWQKNKEAKDILLWYFKLLEKIILIGMILMLFSGVIMATGPVLMYILFGRMQLMYVCYIPFVDYTKHPGFDVNALVHGWISECFFFSVAPLIGLVLLMLTMACAKVDILREQLRNLTKHLEENEYNDETNDLNSICKEHQELIEFVGEMEDRLSMQQLTDHFILGSQICLSLFICFQKFWLPGYVTIIFGTLGIFTLDLLGTIIDMKFEMLYMDVWNVPWYLMSLKNQKTYLYFLGNAQKTSLLSVGGRAPLCLDTFVRLYKGIYSYLMVLRETQV